MHIKANTNPAKNPIKSNINGPIGQPEVSEVTTSVTVCVAVNKKPKIAAVPITRCALVSTGAWQIFSALASFSMSAISLLPGSPRQLYIITSSTRVARTCVLALSHHHLYLDNDPKPAAIQHIPHTNTNTTFSFLIIINHHQSN